MNDLSRTTQLNPSSPAIDALAGAREETYHALGLLAHYCHCARIHLEVADDPVTLYDLTTAKHYFDLAMRSFEPVRASFRKQIADAEKAA